MNAHHGKGNWSMSSEGEAVLMVAEPVNRARMRLAVMEYVKDYGRPPLEETRRVIRLLFGSDAADGFDEGVDLAYRV